MEPRNLSEVIAKIGQRQAAEAIITEAVEEYGFTEAEVSEMLAEENDPTTVEERIAAAIRFAESVCTKARVAIMEAEAEKAPNSERIFVISTASPGAFCGVSWASSSSRGPSAAGRSSTGSSGTDVSGAGCALGMS